QRPVRREDQLYGVLTELLGVVRGTGHLNILPQTTVWFQGVRSQGGTSGVVLRPATEQRPRPATLGHPRRTPPSDHHLDRTDLPPPTPPTTPRPTHTGRV